MHAMVRYLVEPEGSNCKANVGFTIIVCALHMETLKCLFVNFTTETFKEAGSDKSWAQMSVVVCFVVYCNCLLPSSSLCCFLDHAHSCPGLAVNRSCLALCVCVFLPMMDEFE